MKINKRITPHGMQRSKIVDTFVLCLFLRMCSAKTIQCVCICIYCGLSMKIIINTRKTPHGVQRSKMVDAFVLCLFLCACLAKNRKTPNLIPMADNTITRGGIWGLWSLLACISVINTDKKMIHSASSIIHCLVTLLIRAKQNWHLSTESHKCTSIRKCAGNFMINLFDYRLCRLPVMM